MRGDVVAAAERAPDAAALDTGALEAEAGAALVAELADAEGTGAAALEQPLVARRMTTMPSSVRSTSGA